MQWSIGMSHFVLEKLKPLIEVIRQSISREVMDIPAFRFWEEDIPGGERPDLDDTGWQNFSVGSTWGGYDKVAWFRARVAIPQHLRGGNLALRFLVGPRDGGKSTAETMLYVDGAPQQGIDIWHTDAMLTPEQAQQVSIFVALRAWSGVYGPPPKRCFRLAQLVQIDRIAEQFYFLAKTLKASAEQLDKNDLRRGKIETALTCAFRQVAFWNPGSTEYYDSLSLALADLQKSVEGMCARELKPTVHAVGHSHIDMAWMWRLHHTREKAQRTFTTVTNLMRQYPEYRYVHSSPQLYEYVKQDNPKLYEQVRELAREGRWEVTGGMWIESETLISAGESLVRQFLLGQRFYRDEFGKTTRVLWLPDSFGFTGILPQLMRQAGVKYFASAVISWSRFNRFPYDTFTWRGIDGSEVLANFITTPGEHSKHYSYIGRMEPNDVMGTWTNYQQKEINDRVLLTFGWGDGGGGPTREMLESARALRNVPGMPYVEIGPVEEFFTRLESSIPGLDLPAWDGELYLEALRGSYTSQGRTKRAQRKTEVLLHEAEWLNALVDIFTGSNDYPHESLNEGWKKLLLNQFHDILPGTSITDVHEDSLKDYTEVQAVGQAALKSSEARLVESLPVTDPGLLVLNSLSHVRDGLVELPMTETLQGKTVAMPDGSPLPVQVVEAGSKLLFAVPPVPSMGYAAFPLHKIDAWDAELAAAEANLADFFVSPERMENNYWCISLDKTGRIVSLFDKRAGRSVLAEGALGNDLQAFEDRTLHGEAWELDLYYEEKLRHVDDLREAVVEETGPLRATLRLRWQFLDSTITQRIRLYRHTPRIDFDTEIDWHEHQIMLKAAFPVAARSPRATYDAGFGSVERPTHRNTSFDTAHYENPAHRWVDLSQGDWGVSLLNDCKYGYDVHGSVLRLTLHRSPTDPDPVADQGLHHFTYSLLPHEGDWRSETIREAADLNVPLRALVTGANFGGLLAPSLSLAQLDCDHVLLDTVKKAEDGDEWIFRVVELHQRDNTAVRVRFARPPVAVQECNILEEPLSSIPVDGNQITFAVRPFEVKSFRVHF